MRYLYVSEYNSIISVFQAEPTVVQVTTILVGRIIYSKCIACHVYPVIAKGNHLKYAIK